MSDFRTILSLSPSPQKIDLHQSIFTIGSCFADNLGQLLIAHKFKVAVSPFGTSYNPISIHKLLLYAIDNAEPTKNTYEELNETHFNYDFHSSFSTLKRETLETNINNTIKFCHHQIKNTDILIITYGTAWVYHRIDNDVIVSNCHKVKATNFNKQLLTQKKVLESFEVLYKKLKTINPHIRIILTLSPVRHLKDTLELNSVSKSILRLSCHTLSEIYPEVEYFPAYEMVLDDLRDYRFYAPDMLHPSQEGIAYIWKRFCEKYFSTDTIKFINTWSDLSKSLAHKPFLPTSSSHQAFLNQLILQLEELKPRVNVDKELDQIRKHLIY